MTWFYLALFFSMGSEDYATRSAAFKALKNMPEARRAVVVWGGTSTLELAMRRKALEKYWEDNFIPRCPVCGIGWHYGYDFPDGLITNHLDRRPAHSPVPATAPGGIYGPIIILGPPRCQGSGQVPIYRRKE